MFHLFFLTFYVSGAVLVVRVAYVIFDLLLFVVYVVVPGDIARCCHEGSLVDL